MTSTAAVTNEAPRGRVEAAIRQAAARSGLDFSYLYNQAWVESGLNPNAQAGNSSGAGLFGFLDQAWLGTIDKHGGANGLGWASNAVERGRDGRYFVSDPGLRRQVMELRRQPEAASAMAAALATDNRAHLQARLDRPLQSVDLYMAHFLGAGGATRFLRAHDATPNATAATAFGRAARANHNIFYKRDGSARTFAEVRNLLAAKLGTHTGFAAARTAPAARTAQPAAVAPAPVTDMAYQLSALREGMSFGQPTRVQPEYARLAYLMLAELGA